MPMLLKLNIPPAFLSLNWLCSPILGMMLHPVLGQLSDTYGRRPFVLLLGWASAIGLALLPVLQSMGSSPVALVAFFVVFGIVDTCHDLLLTPTRAAMNDMYSPEECERRSAIAGGVGKVVALICVVVLGGEKAFAATAAIIFLVTTVQLIAPHDRQGDARTIVAPLAPPMASEEGTPSGASPSDASPADAPGSRKFPAGFASVWVLSCAGWFAVCVLSFGSTSCWGERSGALPGTPEFEKGVKVASALFMGSTCIFMLSGGTLPFLVRLFGGHLNALLAALIAMTATMLSFAPQVPSWATGACIILLYPPSYQIVANVPFGWLEEQPSFSASQRGRLTGWFNSSLAVAQAITSVFTGPVVAAAHGHLFASFVAAAAFCGVIAFGALASVCFRRVRRVSA